MLHLTRRDRCTSAGAAIVTLLMLVQLLAGCSSKKAAGPSATSHVTATTSTTTIATTTTQPPANDDAVIPILNDLLHQWDTLMEITMQDPRGWLTDPSPAGKQILRSAFTAESPFVRDFNRLIKRTADKGVAARPATSGTSRHTEVAYIPIRNQPDSLEFVWCSVDRGVMYDLTTKETVNDDLGIVTGGGTARRVGGRWRLDRLFQLGVMTYPHGSTQQCPQP